MAKKSHSPEMIINKLREAEILLNQGNSVTIIEMLPTVASDMEILHHKVLLDSLKAQEVVMLTKHQMVSVAKRGVEVINNKNGERKSLAADWVVLALGMKPVTALTRALEEKVSELYTAGDCEEPRKILEAVYEGSLAGRQL